MFDLIHAHHNICEVEEKTTAQNFKFADGNETRDQRRKPNSRETEI